MSSDSQWASSRVWPNRAITSSCRPYNTRKECKVPKWRPLEINNGIRTCNEGS